VEYLGHINPTSRGEKIQHPSRIEEADEKDKIQKMHLNSGTRQADRETISYPDSIYPSLIIPQTTIGLPEYQSQQGEMGHIRPMGIQDDLWLKTIKTNKPRLISTNPTFQAVITTDASPIAWGATFQAINQNTKLNPRKEMEKLSQEEKNLAILSENGKLYCPTFQVELYRSVRAENSSIFFYL
jgi:hypothetical protein